LRVSENRVVRRIFGLNREQVTEKWRVLLTRSFVIYTLRFTLKIIKLRRRRVVDQAACIGEV
jgi:hypothetical protein